MVLSVNKKEVIERNSRAWDLEVNNRHWATLPLSEEKFRDLARQGFPISFTGLRPLPEKWLGDIKGKSVLCLACGGGQQTVLLAARGAKVTSLENSEKQLNSDIDTASLFGLNVHGILGSMDDPGAYPDEKFDIVVLGMGAQFLMSLPEVFSLIQSHLLPHGYFIGSFVNPICYLFDWKRYEEGDFVVRHRVPYSDIDAISEEERSDLLGEDSPIEFGHSLEEIFGGLCAVQLAIIDYIEEYDSREKMGEHFPSYFSLLAKGLVD